jgi:hypothetical protein
MARVVLVLSIVAAGCATPPRVTMNEIAERYVRLVLLVGQHDSDFVDAYYGDPAWAPTATPVSLDELAARVRDLRTELSQIVVEAEPDEIVRLRRQYLEKQLIAVETRVAMLAGARLPFDVEVRRLYDVDPPRTSDAEFAAVRAELETLLPGRGALIDRYAGFRDRYVIPPDRVDRVFRAAIDACRARTAARMALPSGETFTVEYVTGKSWSAYNWYKGNFTSVIQVNTELPITIDRAIDLACHEGYPGHHVYNALLEQALVRGRGWVEYTVYPLFSPQSLIAEGTANFGIEVAFPGDERLRFERETLYPLAGLDPGSAAAFAAVQRTVDKLAYAGNEAARRYLDGTIDREAAARWLQEWAMTPADRALQRTKFFDQYRSYVINYTVGEDLVRAYVESRGGTTDHPDVRWREFAALLSSPRLPSGL